ncbi:class I SAM-dependent methyltransferase [Salipaludibacillus aurantiacus]|uniref:SAM-dependent methyltransferase, MidA family n=1 Tax=Salipaludibacillus aurantiacus TaxID=1601833 RepID=A0A1H9R6I4_9BACI|nr:SAM-dependent methyltransferase [Salipaludibacillus aurantiacus]SER68227.1 SAM-dependent methyltransferase, MidA family [Salipaludibacillus aurantiacus]
MNELIAKLKEKSTPPWNFAFFMDTALYDPEAGYYTKNRLKLGKEGDFYTSNHVHPVFAETFARFFSDVFIKEKIQTAICEQGAGDGAFAYHTLSYFIREKPQVFKDLRYYIIESSPYHQRILLNRLDEFRDCVEIYASLSELREKVPHFDGIFFSNELLDAFPVHIVEQGEEGLKEVYVEPVNSSLHEKVLPCRNEEVINWIARFGPDLPPGFRTEVSLEMENWIRETAGWINKGMLVTVDYGYRNEELIQPERKEGSIRGYYNHEMVNDPLKRPGEMDLTSHIPWDAYEKIVSEEGFNFVCHERQDHFLLKAGLFSFLEEPSEMNPFSKEFKKNRAIQSLVHPGGISSSFQVNIYGRDLKEAENYSLFHEDPYQIKKP